MNGGSKMMNTKKRSMMFIILIGILLIFSACSDKVDTAAESPNKKDDEINNEKVEQVTIKVAIPLNEDYFNGRFGAADEMLEHIDLEYIPYGSSVQSLEELFASNQNPDIIIGDFPPVKELDLAEPLDDLIEKHSFDLDRFDPSLLSLMRSYDDEGRVMAFPDGGSFFALYYNKDVFDKLGKEYPDPDVPMTWDEVIELSREMTREMGGEQYIGLQGGPGAALGQLGARRTDPDTGEVLVEKDPKFKKYFDLVESYYSIPGLDNPELSDNPFVEEQTAAMVIASNNYFSWGWGNPDPESISNIDMAPIPVWADLPNTTPAKNAWPMVIANYSEHKDEAFQVLAAYFDVDVQIGMAKTMMLQTPLIDSEILEHYGSEVPAYEGKNIQAYFFGEAAEYEGKQSSWDQYVDIGEATRKIREDKIDVVTVLRELAEESDGKIKEAMAGQ